MEPEHTSHTVYRIAYHLCWIPKYRKMVLKSGIADALRALNIEIASHYDFKILEQEVLPEHVHVLLSAPPRYSPSRVVHILKSITARELFKQFPELRKQYW